MPTANVEVAAVLERIAELLELQDANPFRVRAYRNAERVVQALSQPVLEWIAAGHALDDLAGIGPDLAEKIETIARTGTHPLLAELQQGSPPGLADLLTVRGLGPKRVRRLHDALGVTDLASLERAARAGRVAELPGFGARTQENLLAALAARPAAPARVLWPVADALARPLVAWLAGVPSVEAVLVAGSYRRRRATVGDLDVLVCAPDREAVARRVRGWSGFGEILAQGITGVTARLPSGLQVDVRVVPAAGWGAAQHYFTGSKAHNIAVRKRGVDRGLKINEYGVFRGRRRVAGADEESVFRAVGLPWIPPELREDSGEIEAADAGRLPTLVTLADLRGDLHVHSDATDGRDPLRAMALEARRRGLTYLASTEHTANTRIAHGLDADAVLRHLDRIDALNDELDGFRVLKSAEVDILEDGRLDLPRRVLERLDLVVGAVHDHLDQPAERLTRRILTAMDQPFFHILAHPTGVLLGRRNPSSVDLDEVLRGARERGCFVEINGQPERADLDDVHARHAKELGVRVSIASDAHGADQLGHLELGVAVARRGWLEPDDVLNTRPLDALLSLLKR